MIFTIIVALFLMDATGTTPKPIYEAELEVAKVVCAAQGLQTYEDFSCVPKSFK